MASSSNATQKVDFVKKQRFARSNADDGSWYMLAFIWTKGNTEIWYSNNFFYYPREKTFCLMSGDDRYPDAEDRYVKFKVNSNSGDKIRVKMTPYKKGEIKPRDYNGCFVVDQPEFLWFGDTDKSIIAGPFTISLFGDDEKGKIVKHTKNCRGKSSFFKKFGRTNKLPLKFISMQDGEEKLIEEAELFSGIFQEWINEMLKL